jgi:hypothetical protein
MLAVMHGKTGCMEKLIQAGANVCLTSGSYFYCPDSMHFKEKNQ